MTAVKFRGANGFVATIDLDGDRGSAEFKAARKRINQRMNETLADAGKAIILPDAKSRAGRLKVEGTPVSDYLTVKARSGKKLYLTISTQRKKVRAPVAWLEFGGTNDSALRPKRPNKAVMTPWGPRKVVYRGEGGRGKPAVLRPAKGRRFMGKAVNSRTNRWRTERLIVKNLDRLFERELS